jgi:hypothetical protein
MHTSILTKCTVQEAKSSVKNLVHIYKFLPLLAAPYIYTTLVGLGLTLSQSADFVYDVCVRLYFQVGHTWPPSGLMLLKICRTKFLNILRVSTLPTYTSLLKFTFQYLYQ